MDLVSRPLLLMLWATPPSVAFFNRGDKPQHLGFLWQNSITAPSGCAPRAANSWRGTIIPKKPKCLNASVNRRCLLRRGAASATQASPKRPVSMRVFNFTCDRATAKLVVDEGEPSRAHNVEKKLHCRRLSAVSNSVRNIAIQAVLADREQTMMLYAIM
jgi:hypothetical protein